MSQKVWTNKSINPHNYLNAWTKFKWILRNIVKVKNSQYLSLILPCRVSHFNNNLHFLHQALALILSNQVWVKVKWKAKDKIQTQVNKFLKEKTRIASNKLILTKIPFQLMSLFPFCHWVWSRSLNLKLFRKKSNRYLTLPKMKQVYSSKMSMALLSYKIKSKKIMETTYITLI